MEFLDEIFKRHIGINSDNIGSRYHDIIDPQLPEFDDVEQHGSFLCGKILFTALMLDDHAFK